MKVITPTVSHVFQRASDVVCETLWPTRCALCDRPFNVLCDTCRQNLPFLDYWKACLRCGAPYGYCQCDICNPLVLERLSYTELPFEGCASAVQFTNTTGQLVRIYKDQGERRLASVFAEMIGHVVPEHWQANGLTFIPASRKAFRHRGFDHGELLAHEVALVLGLPLYSVFQRPQTKDQRTLDSTQRRENLKTRFQLRQDACFPASLFLVDDVFTTGSTICAAASVLKAAGVEHLYCLTFARV